MKPLSLHSQAPSRRSRFVIVDDEDFDFVAASRWCYMQRGIPAERRARQTAIWRPTYHKVRPQGVYAVQSGTREQLHRLILEHHGHAIDGLHILFANGWGLDCRKSNLLLGTRADCSRTRAHTRIECCSVWSWVTGGETHDHIRRAVAAARRLGLPTDEIKQGPKIPRYRAALGPTDLGCFPTFASAEAAAEAAAAELGYVVHAERERLRAELVDDLTALVAGGVLIVADAEAARLEDRYRLPLSV